MQGRDQTLGRKVHLLRHKGSRQRTIRGGPPACALAGLGGDSASADCVQILAGPWKTCRAPRRAQRQPLPRQGRAPQAPSRPSAAKRAPPRRAGAATPRGAAQPISGPPPLPAGKRPEPGGPGGSAGAAFPLAEAAPPKQSPTVLRTRTPWLPSPSSSPDPPPSIPSLLPRRPHLPRSSYCPDPVVRPVLQQRPAWLVLKAAGPAARPQSSILPKGAAGREGALTVPATIEPPGRRGRGGVLGRTERRRRARCP